MASGRRAGREGRGTEQWLCWETRWGRGHQVSRQIFKPCSYCMAVTSFTDFQEISSVLKTFETKKKKEGKNLLTQPGECARQSHCQIWVCPYPNQEPQGRQDTSLKAWHIRPSWVTDTEDTAPLQTTEKPREHRGNWSYKVMTSIRNKIWARKLGFPWEYA